MNAMVVLTGVLVGITAAYAILTYRMAKASEASVSLMKEQVDAIGRPYVAISLVKPPNNISIRLRIENTGRTPAENLTLSLGPEFEKIKDIEGMKRLSGSHMFTTTTASFPPQSPVFFFLGFGETLHGNDNKKYPQEIFTITAKYSFAGRKVSETTTIDVNQYNSTNLETNPIVEALDRIKDTIAKK